MAKGCFPRSPATAITIHVLFDDGPTDSNCALAIIPLCLVSYSASSYTRFTDRNLSPNSFTQLFTFLREIAAQSKCSLYSRLISSNASSSSGPPPSSWSNTKRNCIFSQFSQPSTLHSSVSPGVRDSTSPSISGPTRNTGYTTSQ